MTKYIDRVGASLLAVALCVLGAIVIKFQQDETQEAQLRQAARSLQEILDQASTTLSSLKDVENLQRGYLITGNLNDLRLYNLALTSFRRKLGTLSDSVTSQVEGSVIVNNFSSAVEARIGELRTTVQLRSAGDKRLAAERVLRGEGTSSIESARALVDQLIQSEKEQLSDMRTRIGTATRQSHRTVLFGCAVLFLLVTAGTLLLAQEAKLLRISRASLEESQQRYRALAESLEDQVHARTKELIALNSELEAFSFSVSHDLRAPLRSIDGFSLIILEDYADKLDENGRAFLMRIRAAAGRMGQLIKSLLELSRVNRAELKRERVSVSSIAASIVTGLRAQDPEREVEVRVADGMVAEADPELTYVVLENLLSNAWKFSSKQARAVIEVKADHEETRSTFCVADNGTGFDPAYSERLYTPFQRLHAASEFEGIGIGLATVKRVIHRHGGEIWAESWPGEGARFYFTLS